MCGAVRRYIDATGCKVPNTKWYWVVYRSRRTLLPLQIWGERHHPSPGTLCPNVDCASSYPLSYSPPKVEGAALACANGAPICTIWPGNGQPLARFCYLARGLIHEGPSRYRDHKANRPDSYGPLTCSEEAVFMKAGQQGPQLSARVFLNHDLVTDCACVLKEMCTFPTR